MTGATVLLVFLLVLSIGISTILYVSKSGVTVRNFNLMCGWGLFAYIMSAFFILLGIVGVISV